MLRSIRPKRATTSLASSVDHTEARNNILGCVGRSDRSAQAIVTCPPRTGPPAVSEYHGRRRSAGCAEDRKWTKINPDR
jgi:hypothetical protein